MCKFIEDLLRPHVFSSALVAGCQAMAADETREAGASEWRNALSKDLSDETR